MCYRFPLDIEQCVIVFLLILNNELPYILRNILWLHAKMEKPFEFSGKIFYVVEIYMLINIIY